MISLTAYRNGEKWAWYTLWSVPVYFLSWVAIASPLAISKIDPENGLPFVLYSNERIRILCVRRGNDSPSTIEVELSISMRNDSSHAGQKEAICTLISYLNYILRLHERGFRLEAMDDDVLWTAVLDILSEPNIEIFETLLPPIGY